MRTAIVGSGGIAAIHAAALRRLGHEPVLVVGRTAEGAAAFAKRNGIERWATALGEALQGDIDAVHICTPPALHVDEITACLKAGKHVVSEKPLCLCAAEAAALAALAKEMGLVAALCCNVRYYPANRAAAELLQSGAAGKPLLIHGEYLQEFHAPPHADGWRFDPALGGNMRAITEIGTHWADLARYWTGLRITEVCAALGNFYPTRYRHDRLLTLEENDHPVVTDTEDAAAVALRFEGGAVGTVLLSEVSRGHGNDLTLEVACAGKSVRWSETRPQELMYSGANGMAAREHPPVRREDTFLPLFAAAYAAMAGEAAGGYPTFDDGAYLAAVCDAIQKSAQAGGWVRV